MVILNDDPIIRPQHFAKNYFTLSPLIFVSSMARSPFSVKESSRDISLNTFGTNSSASSASCSRSSTLQPDDQSRSASDRMGFTSARRRSGSVAGRATGPSESRGHGSNSKGKLKARSSNKNDEGDSLNFPGPSSRPKTLHSTRSSDEYPDWRDTHDMEEESAGLLPHNESVSKPAKKSRAQEDSAKRHTRDKTNWIETISNAVRGCTPGESRTIPMNPPGELT